MHLCDVRVKSENADGQTRVLHLTNMAIVLSSTRAHMKPVFDLVSGHAHTQPITYASAAPVTIKPKFKTAQQGVADQQH